MFKELAEIMELPIKESALSTRPLRKPTTYVYPNVEFSAFSDVNRSQRRINHRRRDASHFVDRRACRRLQIEPEADASHLDDRHGRVSHHSCSLLSR